MREEYHFIISQLRGMLTLMIRIVFALIIIKYLLVAVNVVTVNLSILVVVFSGALINSIRRSQEVSVKDWGKSALTIIIVVTALFYALRLGAAYGVLGVIIVFVAIYGYRVYKARHQLKASVDYVEEKLWQGHNKKDVRLKIKWGNLKGQRKN